MYMEFFKLKIYTDLLYTLKKQFHNVLLNFIFIQLKYKKLDSFIVLS